MKIEATLEEKEKLLVYEIYMFRQACKELKYPRQKSQFQVNLLVEALAIHARILIDFFYGIRVRENDIIAQDFMKKNTIWKEMRPNKTEFLKDAKNKADKQLAHLSVWRVKLEKEGKKGWNVSKISEDMEEVIKKFNDHKL
jgi:hypothetical protein